jgi:hypothetical protein
VYHGYENGFWTLGRQTLLDPMHFTPQGWIVADGGDLSRPLRKPGGGRALPHGAPLSDNFSGSTAATPMVLLRPWPRRIAATAFRFRRAAHEGQGAPSRMTVRR